MKQLSWLMMVGVTCFGLQAYVIAGPKSPSSQPLKQPGKTKKTAPKAAGPAGLFLKDSKGHTDRHKRLWHRKALDKRCPKGHQGWITMAPGHQLRNTLGWVVLCLPHRKVRTKTSVKTRATALFEKKLSWKTLKARRRLRRSVQDPSSKSLMLPPSLGRAIPRHMLYRWKPPTALLPQRFYAMPGAHWRGKGTVTIIYTRFDKQGRPHGVRIQGTLKMHAPSGISGIGWAGLKPGDIKRTVTLSGELTLVEKAHSHK